MKKRTLSLSAFGLVTSAALALSPSTSRGSPDDAASRPAVFAPELGFEPSVAYSDPEQNPRYLALMRRGKLTETVRSRTYGRLEADPLVIEAAWIISTGLERQAQGVFVTSLARTPEDQWRLMHRRDTRWWTIQRSKHLMGGLAADIGFVGRRKSMNWMRDRAQQLLERNLGSQVAGLLRVVREAHCIHVELNSLTARSRIDSRRQALENLGIVAVQGPHPVPSLGDYVPEHAYQMRPRGTLQMAVQ